MNSAVKDIAFQKASTETGRAPLGEIADGHITREALCEFSSRVGKQLRVNNQYNDVASRLAILRFVDGIGDENPLWRSSDYAAHSPYRHIVAPPSFPLSVFPAWILQGLPGVHAVHTSTDWTFHRPIYEGDTIRPESFFTSFDVKESAIGGKTIVERQQSLYYNQRDELVAMAYSAGYRMERGAVRERKREMSYTLPHPWTQEELSRIEDDVLSERPRGGSELYWEDVELGQRLPTVTKGPLGLTDMIAYCIGASPVAIKAHASSLKLYTDRPAWCFRDPATLALEPIYSVHYNPSTAAACGFPYPYDVGVQRHCWLIQLLTNWMGDYGWLKRSEAKYTKFVYLSDVVRLSGKVVGKHIDEDGDYCVEIETSAINQRGQEVMPGHATIALPHQGNPLNALHRRVRS